MRIGLDIMGSDHGPVVPVRGAVLAARELPADVRLVLIGDQALILELLQAEGADPSAFDIVPSEDDITMNDNPTKAFQAKPRSSISIGFHLMKEGKIDAFASTGNTGAMLVGSIFSHQAYPWCHPTVHPHAWFPRKAEVSACCWMWGPMPIASRMY